MSRRTGGCLCSAVWYMTEGEPVMRAFCHCPSCRLATGAPVVAWALFPQDAFRITRGELAVYESSPGVRRGFCGRCGTTLSFEADYVPGLIDVTIATFGDPAGLVPQMHVWHRHRLGWVVLADDLPRHEELPPLE
jgi:hypothetical protein